MAVWTRALRIVVACVAAFALCIPLVARAQTKLLVIPFGDVSSNSGKMPSPTRYLVTRLAQAHVGVMQAPPLDPIIAATNAAALCRELGADGVLIANMNLTSRPKFSLLGTALGAAPGVAGAAGGGVAATGMFSRTALHAMVHLYLLDCEGKLRWHAITAAEAMHHGNNVGAGFTSIVERAIGDAVVQFVASCHPEPLYSTGSGRSAQDKLRRGATKISRVSATSAQAAEPHFRVGSCLEPVRSAQAR